MIKDDGSEESPLQGSVTSPTLEQQQQQLQLQLQQLQQQHQAATNELNNAKSQMPPYAGVGLGMNTAAATGGGSGGMPNGALQSPFDATGAGTMFDSCLFDWSRRRMEMAERAAMLGFPPATVGSSGPTAAGMSGGGGGGGGGGGNIGNVGAGTGLPFGSPGGPNPMSAAFGMGQVQVDSNMLQRMARGVPQSPDIQEEQNQQLECLGPPENLAEQEKRLHRLREQQEERLRKMRQNQEDRKRERAGMPIPPGFDLGSVAAMGGDLGVVGGGIPTEGMSQNQRTGVGGQQTGVQWWVCRKCQARAFASKEQALDHEAMCQMGQQQQVNQDGISLDANAGPQQNFVDDNFFPFQRNVPSGFGMPFQPPLPMMDMAAMRRNIEQNQMELEQHLAMQSAAAAAQAQAAALQQQGIQANAGPLVNSSPSLSGNGVGSFHQAINDSNLAEAAPIGDGGQYAILPKPIPLAMSSDKDWITPLHCFIRRHCVEVFTATAADVATPSKGKRRPIQVGQVGIRCPHCHSSDSSHHQGRERGSVYYPTTISSIYNATMNLLQRHLDACPSIPLEIMSRYRDLKADDARSATSKKYWINSAKSLGLVDTKHGGIRFSSLSPPPLPQLSMQQVSGDMRSATRRNSLEFFANRSEVSEGTLAGSKRKLESEEEDDDCDVDGPLSQGVSENDDSNNGRNEGPTPFREPKRAIPSPPPLVLPEDKSTATAFSFKLLSQMRPCVFTEADRLGKRKGLPAGFAGLACRHCYGGYGSGRFFPSSIKTLSDTSKTLNVLHNHMMRCRKCPVEVRDRLQRLKRGHDEERARMKFGSQKAFFAKIWDRLHNRVLDPANPPPVIKNDGGESPEIGSTINDNNCTLEGTKTNRPSMVGSSLSLSSPSNLSHHPMVAPFMASQNAHPQMALHAATMANMMKPDPSQAWTGAGIGGTVGIPMPSMTAHAMGPPNAPTRHGMRPGAA